MVGMDTLAIEMSSTFMNNAKARERVRMARRPGGRADRDCEVFSAGMSENSYLNAFTVLDAVICVFLPTGPVVSQVCGGPVRRMNGHRVCSPFAMMCAADARPGHTLFLTGSCRLSP